VIKDTFNKLMMHYNSLELTIILLLEIKQ